MKNAIVIDWKSNSYPTNCDTALRYKSASKTESGCTDCPDQKDAISNDETVELAKILLKERKIKSLKGGSSLNFM